MRKILIVIGVLTIAVGIIWAGRAWSTFRVNAKTARFNEDVDSLFFALQKYKEQVGGYPAGGNLEVAKALMGSNSKKVIVIVGNRIRVNEKGEFVDPWGTPMRMYFSDVGALIRCAGPNRRFDDSTVIDADDYIRSN
jgi:hypothetical protein